MMLPGLYVVRVPHNGSGSRLIVESRPFQKKEGFSDDWVRNQADNWRDFIQSEHPRDEVFVIERKADDVTC